MPNIVVIGESKNRERRSSLVCRDLSAAVHKWKNKGFEEDITLDIQLILIGLVFYLVWFSLLGRGTLLFLFVFN